MLYTTKKPIDGYKVLGKFGAGKQLVGVPTKYINNDLRVIVLSNNQVIKPVGEPLKIETFNDKFGRGEYELGYFELKQEKGGV